MLEYNPVLQCVCNEYESNQSLSAKSGHEGLTKDEYEVATSISLWSAAAPHHNLPAAKAPAKSDAVISIGIVMIGSGREADGSAGEACNALETDFLSVPKGNSSGSCACSSKPSVAFDILQKRCLLQ